MHKINVTRLFVGGPYDAKYVSVELYPSQLDKEAVAVPDPIKDKVIDYSIGDEPPKPEYVKSHLYYPYSFYQDGKCQHIIMRHKDIKEQDVMSTVLQGYVKNCLHKL